MSKSYEIPVAVHVGELLKEWLKENGMTSKELAIRVNKPEKTISQILNGKSGITTETARALEIVTGMPADYLLRFQSQYNEAKARLEAKPALERLFDEWGGAFPYNDMMKKAWVAVATSASEKMENLLRFFSLTVEEAFDTQYSSNLSGVSYRLTGKSNRTSFGVAAWVRQGEILAGKMSVPPLSAPSIDKMKTDLKDENFSALVSDCASSGIKLVFVDTIPSASVSGAALWRGGSPIIILSNKGKSLDKITFNFFHELGHIILKHNRKTIFVDDLEEYQRSEEEDAANAFANSVLFSDLKDFASKPTIQEIADEAFRIGIHPSVLLGHLCHDGVIKYPEAASRYKSLQRHLEFSDLIN